MRARNLYFITNSWQRKGRSVEGIHIELCITNHQLNAHDRPKKGNVFNFAVQNNLLKSIRCKSKSFGSDSDHDLIAFRFTYEAGSDFELIPIHVQDSIFRVNDFGKSCIQSSHETGDKACSWKIIDLLRIGKGLNISVRSPRGILTISRTQSQEHILISLLKEDANPILAANKLPETIEYLNEQLV